MENQAAFDTLRKRYPRFIYRSFHYTVTENRLDFGFHFAIENVNGTVEHEFRPELSIPGRDFYRPEAIPDPLLETLVFHCGMVELVSYWKCCCCPEVLIECGKLASAQIEWFKKLYFNGLGEFFYLNSIRTNLQDFMRLVCARQKNDPEKANPKNLGQHPQTGQNTFFYSKKNIPLTLDDNIIVPIGGGKDSVVTLEILRRKFDRQASGRQLSETRSARSGKIRPLIINPRGASRNCCLQAGYEDEDCIVINRSIDKHLLELNAQGYLNGHTPFSAMLAFVTLIAAALNGSRHIALSNENSANESTVPGQNINHQYSKSLEFESDFRHYVQTFISPEFNYFSFLRPLSELGIARLFASLPLYHSIFRSCNAGSKTDSWCGRCPKCLFAFIILCPFTGIKKATRLFGKNLLDDPSLQCYLDELCGIAAVKPFECVGTVEEVNWALQQLRPYTEGNCLLTYYFSRPQSRNTVSDHILEDFSAEHHLPEPFAATLEAAVEEVRRFQGDNHRITPPVSKPIREQFVPLIELLTHRGLDTIVILGLGREGRSSYRFLRRLFPEYPLLLVDADEKIMQDPLFSDDPYVRFIVGKDYLECLQQDKTPLGLILKTPGISLREYPDLLQHPALSSQTGIFLHFYHAQTIGITGTKGKSTTTLLTHHLLHPFFPCIAAGNMGIPLFDILDEIGPNTRIIGEFSAHQLEQSHSAPHIGVLLNLFEEHLDHFCDFEAYQKAKMRIAGHPKHRIFIFHEDDPKIRPLLAEKFPEPTEVTLEQLIEEALAEKGMPDPLPADPETNLRTFSLGHPVKNGLYVQGNRILDPQGNCIFDLNTPHPLIGNHNLLNLMAALLAAHATGVPYEKLCTRIASFTPLPHRLQYIGCIENIHFFNDSISTIPQATIAALQSIASLPFVKGTDCLIIGGLDRGIDYTPFVDFFRRHSPANHTPESMKSIIFVGAAGRRIRKLLEEANLLPPYTLSCDDYPTLVAWAKQHVRPGYACLLSPAAASYDQFKNFAHRGQVFTTLVTRQQ